MFRILAVAGVLALGGPVGEVFGDLLALGGVLVGVDSDKDQTLVLVTPVQLLKVRHGRLARPSPEGPEVQQDDLALHGCEGGRRGAAPIHPLLHLEGGRGFAFVRVLGGVAGAVALPFEPVAGSLECGAGEDAKREKHDSASHGS